MPIYICLAIASEYKLAQANMAYRRFDLDELFSFPLWYSDYDVDNVVADRCICSLTPDAFFSITQRDWILKAFNGSMSIVGVKK